MANITLDLPLPLSVNRSRKIDWAAKRAHDNWVKLSNALVMRAGTRWHSILGPWEAHITISPISRQDLDNCIKVLVDYLVRIKVVTGDGPDYLKKLTIEFGAAPEGARVVLTPFKPEIPHVTGYRRQAMVNVLYKTRIPMHVIDIEDAVYGTDPRPDRRVVPVMRKEINRQLEPQGWVITATGGPSSVYRLERIPS